MLNKKTIANHLTLLVTMLNVAVDLGWLTKVPRIRKPKVRLISAAFSYLRTDEEIARFLRAAEAEGEVTYALYAMAVNTGTRRKTLSIQATLRCRRGPGTGSVLAWPAA